MAYTANKYRKENTKPAPAFEVDGVFITGIAYMHGEWCYVINNAWECESCVSEVLTRKGCWI